MHEMNVRKRLRSLTKEVRLDLGYNGGGLKDLSEEGSVWERKNDFYREKECKMKFD